VNTLITSQLSPVRLQGGAKAVAVEAERVAVVTTITITLIVLLDTITLMALVALSTVQGPTLGDRAQGRIQDHLDLLVLIRVLAVIRGAATAPLVLRERKRRRNNVANDLATASSKPCYVA
jgi:hypothetical protein